jgi:hypothetical protein
LRQRATYGRLRNTQTLCGPNSGAGCNEGAQSFKFAQSVTVSRHK